MAGSVIYRFIIAVALRLNVPAECLKLISAVIVALAIAAPYHAASAGVPPPRADRPERSVQAVLELRHISKTFNPGTVNEKTALQDLSLTLKDGDFVTILGSNGAGKSTLFNAIAGGFCRTRTHHAGRPGHDGYARLQPQQVHRPHVSGPDARHGTQYDD